MSHVGAPSAPRVRMNIHTWKRRNGLGERHVKTVCTKAVVAVLRYHSSTTSKDADSRGTGPRTKGRMLVACRIGFLSTFVAAMGLSAVATQNVGASSEDPIG